MERPALEVVARLPLLAEGWARHVVDPGHGQVIVDEARRIRGFDPAIGVRALEVLAAHADADHPAARQLGLCRGGGGEIPARELAREGVGRGGRHAEQGSGAQELAPVDAALRQLLFQDGNIFVFAVVTHSILPRWRSPWASQSSATVACRRAAARFSLSAHPPGCAEACQERQGVAAPARKPHAASASSKGKLESSWQPLSVISTCCSSFTPSRPPSSPM